jgi:cytochrome c
MKQLAFILFAFIFFSCKQEEKKEALYPKSGSEATTEGPTANLSPSESLGKEIFEEKGNCFSCHKPEQKVIGPSIIEIAKIYKEKNGDMVAFLRGKADPIVDPSQYEVMKTNFYLTKSFSDKELKGLEDYFMSYLNQKQ